jgi:hypothetical protein
MADPAELQRQIRELEAQLAAQQAHEAHGDDEYYEEYIIEEEVIEDDPVEPAKNFSFKPATSVSPQQELKPKSKWDKTPRPTPEPINRTAPATKPRRVRGVELDPTSTLTLGEGKDRAVTKDYFFAPGSMMPSQEARVEYADAPERDEFTTPQFPRSIGDQAEINMGKNDGPSSKPGWRPNKGITQTVVGHRQAHPAGPPPQEPTPNPIPMSFQGSELKQPLQLKKPATTSSPQDSILQLELAKLEAQLEQQRLAEQLSAAPATVYGPRPTHHTTKFVPRVVPKGQPSEPGQETPMEVLVGPKLYTKSKLIACTTLAGTHELQFALLFFGNNWTRESKAFMPALLDFYQLVSREQQLEVIYVSTDRNLSEFKLAFTDMPYLAVPTGTAERKNAIANALKIVEVPHVVVLDAATAKVVVVNAVDAILKLPRGDWDAACNLVESWKLIAPVSMDQVQLDTRLLNGNLERGILYWSS